jgi:hypothetical protein
MPVYFIDHKIYIGTFYGHFVYFIAIWYILWSFGIFSPFLVHCTKKNLATLLVFKKKRHFFSYSLCVAPRIVAVTRKEMDVAKVLEVSGRLHVLLLRASGLETIRVTA